MFKKNLFTIGTWLTEDTVGKVQIIPPGMEIMAIDQETIEDLTPEVNQIQKGIFLTPNNYYVLQLYHRELM